MKKMQIILSALPDSVYYISNKKSIVSFCLSGNRALTMVLLLKLSATQFFCFCGATGLNKPIVNSFSLSIKKSPFPLDRTVTVWIIIQVRQYKYKKKGE